MGDRESDEKLNIRCWRQQRFLKLGFGLSTSNLLARRCDIDWHEAEKMIRLGATPEQAERILL